MTGARPSPAVVEQAARWAAQLATDDATEADRDACEAWCGQDPAHRVAMDRMRGLDARIEDTDDLGREAIELVLRRRSRTVRAVAGAAFGLVVLGGGWLASTSLPVRGLFPDYETQVGEQRSIALVDGSELMLDTDASIDVDRDADSRRVTLFRGQVLAKVTKDAARPFVVETRDGTATALGTAFGVRRDGDATDVTVVSSRVRACPASEPENCVELLPGGRVRMSGAGIMRLPAVDPESAGMWADGWLAADDRPVVELLRELNRYRKVPIRFDPAELADVRVSGSFPLRDPDRALDGIARSTGLRVSGLADDHPRIYREK